MTAPRLAQKMEERHAAPGEHLSNEGGSGYFFFVIEDGAADVTRDGAVVASLGPTDYFGEIAILATPRSAPRRSRRRRR